MKRNIRDIASDEPKLIEIVRDGIRHAEEGRFVEHSKVVAWVNSWDTADEKDPPETRVDGAEIIGTL